MHAVILFTVQTTSAILGWKSRIGFVTRNTIYHTAVDTSSKPLRWDGRMVLAIGWLIYKTTLSK